MKSSESSAVRLDSLTGLRAVAAFAVFLVHIRFVAGGEPRRVLDLVGGQGAVGVTFFFVLSGFVLTWSWSARAARISAREFYRNRFARIYPAYLVALLAGLIVTVIATGAHPVLGAKFAACVALLQSWIPHVDYYQSVNGVSWSLSCEAFFYLAFPFLIGIVTRHAARHWLPMVAALLAWGVAIDTAADAVGGQVGTWMINALPVTRIAEFVVGSVLAIALRAERLPRIPLLPACLLALAAYAAAGYGEHWLSPYRNAALPLIPFALLIVAFAQVDLARHRSVFRTRPLVYMGEVSYCFYLVHQLVVRAWQRTGVSDSTWRVGLSFIVCLVVALLGAAALHHVIEKPFERRIRHRPRAEPAVTPAS